MIFQNDPSDKEKTYSQNNVCDFSEKVEKRQKRVFCPACGRMEAIQLRSRIKEIDPHAFIIVTTSSEIIGRGFRSV